MQPNEPLRRIQPWSNVFPVSGHLIEVLTEENGTPIYSIFYMCRIKPTLSVSTNKCSTACVSNPVRSFFIWAKETIKHISEPCSLSAKGASRDGHCESGYECSGVWHWFMLHTSLNSIYTVLLPKILTTPNMDSSSAENSCQQMHYFLLLE